MTGKGAESALLGNIQSARLFPAAIEAANAKIAVEQLDKPGPALGSMADLEALEPVKEDFESS